MNTQSTILTIILLCVGSITHAQADSIRLTRTYADVIGDNSQLSININQQGQVQLSLPFFHQFHGQTINYQNTQRSLDVFSKAAEINTLLNHKDLINDLSQARASSPELFYSSDTDMLRLSIENDDNVWSINFSGLQELKHFAQQLPRWQPMIDLIDDIESLSSDRLIQNALENTHEK